MATVQARIRMADHHESLVPVVVPARADVHSFALRVHESGLAWQGEAFGWQAEYIPESAARPLGSRLAFTPAEFWIGESGLWFFSLTWEDGRDAKPHEYLDESGIVRS